MFNADFFPTPENVISQMLEGIDIENKICFEPSAGKGDIIDFLNTHGAKEVLFCETNSDLALISGKKGRFLKSDFLTVEAAEISHIDLIVMNPPFSADEQHILHAFYIAPAGCKIISLANSNTVKNAYSATRKQLKNIIDTYGGSQSLGSCFSSSERTTGVEIELIKIQKPGGDYSTEFDGFFMSEDEEDPSQAGIMSYNFIRDLVNRYVASIKIFDRQLEAAADMKNLTRGYFSVNIGMSIENNEKPIQRNTFKKEMQKSGWNFIFQKMNLKKYATKGLREDINKFVESQHEIPFTMRNIYKMLEIVIATTEQRMERAAVEVFDKVTQHYHENRYGLEGWKTNSHFLLTRRFIFPNVVKQKSFGVGMETTRFEGHYGSNNYELLEDLVKVLSYMNGDNYDQMLSFYDFFNDKFRLKDSSGNFILDSSIDFPVFVGFSSIESAKLFQENHPGSEIVENSPEWGKWNEWGYFRFRAYKKGTCHLEFKSEEVWGRFNQNIARIKGYPLYEKAYRKPENKKTGSKKTQPNTEKKQPIILGTFNIKSK